MNIIRVMSISISLFLFGCASNPMIVSSTQTVAKPSTNSATVVFLRSSFVGSAINASLYDVTSGEPEFIGISANKTKIAYNSPPGKRIFMVVSEAADFMEAELVAGKTYYSIVTPRMGAWKARFSLWPLRRNNTSKHNTTIHKKIMFSTNLVENSTAAKQWYQQHKEDVKKKYEKYLPVWNQKTKQAKAERTLNPNDGA